MTTSNELIKTFTSALAREISTIEFSGMTGDEVFELLGDPARIPDWFVLANSVSQQETDPNTEASFIVDFTFFGEVVEEVLFWDEPRKYIYRASGPDFPIKDYVAEISIEMTGPYEGTLSWKMYFDKIDGARYLKCIPVILPAIVQASIERLPELIGGGRVTHRSNYKGIVQ